MRLTVHRFSLLIVIVSALAGLRLGAQPQVNAEPAQTLLRIARTARGFLEYDPAEPAERLEIQSQSNRIVKNADTLRDLLGDRAVSDSFRRTLTLDALALDRIGVERPPARNVIVTTTGVADDLELKAGYVGASKGAAVADARVLARTWRDKAQERGYRVWFVVRGLVNDPTAHDYFPNFSTPTEHFVPPGGYFMWTRRPDGGPEGTKTRVDVGEPGRPPTTVDLPVPPDR